MEHESLVMFEQLDEPKKGPQVSIGMTLGIFAAYLGGGFGGVCLFIILGERPFGIQIATVITYTYFAFWYVFFPTRGLLEKYSHCDHVHILRFLVRLFPNERITRKI